jgi:CspA family cold shock protein
MNGQILRKMEDKGFGFIAADDGNEYFFHTSGCLTKFDTLREGDNVEFKTEKSAKGPRAKDVERVE